jgi:hypothetical protein
MGIWPRAQARGPPQQGQGCSGAFGSSGLALAALMASIGMRGTASSSRIRAILRDTGLAGEKAVVADAVEARWQDMHQEAADELVGVERHQLVVSLGAFEAVILPLEGDVLVVERRSSVVR